MFRKLALLIVSLVVAPATFAQVIITPVAGVATVDVSTCGQGGASPNPTCSFKLTLSANATLAIINATSGATTKLFINPSTFTLTWPANVSSPPTLTASANNAITLQYDGTTGLWYSSGGGSSSASPSNLTTYFNKFFGLAPQDFGAKGDTHVYFDCGMTTNNHVTCASAHFASTDVGKWIESCSAAGACAGVTVNQGTITVFNSSTDVTVSVTSSTTYTNTRLAFGTDDDAAMQSWAAAMVGAPTLGVPPQVRGGYLPQGGYAIKQPLKIIYPASCGGSSTSTCGEGGPSQGGAGTLSPGLWLTGASTPASFIYVRTAGVFTWPTTADDIGAVTLGNWAFGNISNFAIIADQSAHVTTGITGNNGGLVFSGWIGGAVSTMQHVYTQSLWIQGFHNTTNNFCGLTTSKTDFESSYTYSAVEANDFNGCFCNSTSGQGVTTNCEKIHLDTIFFENPGSHNIIFGTTTAGGGIPMKQISLTNIHSLSGLNALRFIGIQNTTSMQDTVQLFNFRSTYAGAGAALGIRTSGNGMNLDCHGCYLEDTGVSSLDVVATVGAGDTINFHGGSIDCLNCTNAFTNAGNIFIYGTKLAGNPTVANIQTGAGFTYAFIPQSGSNGGWSGKGGIQGTWVANTQGTALVNGNVALSAGWGTTAATTASAGIGNGSFRFTVTASGTGQAANPTITITLPNAWPTATSTCHLMQTGGTGSFTMITQTTLSATAPVFTLQGTPTAAATYVYDGGCGP